MSILPRSSVLASPAVQPPALPARAWTVLYCPDRALHVRWQGRRLDVASQGQARAAIRQAEGLARLPVGTWVIPW